MIIRFMTKKNIFSENRWVILAVWIIEKWVNIVFNAVLYNYMLYNLC